MFINTNSVITWRKHIKISDNVKFGPATYIYDHDHTYLNGKITHEYALEDVEIDDDVWIGAKLHPFKRNTYWKKLCVWYRVYNKR